MVLGGVWAVAVGEALGSAPGESPPPNWAAACSRAWTARLGLLGAIQALLIVWLAGGLLAPGPFPTPRVAAQS